MKIAIKAVLVEGLVFATLSNIGLQFILGMDVWTSIAAVFVVLLADVVANTVKTTTVLAHERGLTFWQAVRALLP